MCRTKFFVIKRSTSVSQRKKKNTVGLWETKLSNIKTKTIDALICVEQKTSNIGWDSRPGAN